MKRECRKEATPLHCYADKTGALLQIMHCKNALHFQYAAFDKKEENNRYVKHFIYAVSIVSIKLLTYKY